MTKMDLRGSVVDIRLPDGTRERFITGSQLEYAIARINSSLRAFTSPLSEDVLEHIMSTIVDTMEEGGLIEN